MISICKWEERFAADFIRLSVEWLEKYVRVEPADEEILYHPHEAVLDNGGMIFFALDGDTPIGTVSMIRMPDGCFELAKLAVTESCKGRGVSKLLMDAALDYAREERCGKVILFTNSCLVPAIGLYHRYGFREVPMEDNEYEESDMRMELDLTANSKMEAIHHIAIICSDRDATLDFYVNKLGFPIIREHYRPERDDWKIDLRIDESAELELFIMKDHPRRVSNPEAYGLRHLAFRVNNVAEKVEELEALGIACEPIRMDAFTGEPMTFFFDPDGLPLEIHE